MTYSLFDAFYNVYKKYYYPSQFYSLKVTSKQSQKHAFVYGNVTFFSSFVVIFVTIIYRYMIYIYTQRLSIANCWLLIICLMLCPSLSTTDYLSITSRCLFAHVAFFTLNIHSMCSLTHSTSRSNAPSLSRCCCL